MFPKSISWLGIGNGNWTTRGYANSQTGHLADWSTHALVNSPTGQLAISQIPPAVVLVLLIA